MLRALFLSTLLLFAACAGDSNFPTATGKGTIRAINAIKSSPDVAFLIEERVLETVPYKSASTPQAFDDFDYIFNFEVSFLGDDEPSRIASPAFKVDADRDYTILLGGTLDDPTTTVWEADEREFNSGDTVFEVRFAHAAASAGPVDVYFAAPGTAPAVGEEVGTLALGEILPGTDFEAGDYVITYTAQGDPANVIFESNTITYISQDVLIAPLFDGDEVEVSEYVMRLVSTAGATINAADTRSSPTVRFIQASFDLPDADVYDDELLMNQVLANHAFGDATGDIDVAAGSTDFTYTAAGNAGAILFEDSFDAITGTHNNFVVIGDDSDRRAISYVPDRRLISTFLKVRLLHASLNHDNVDLFIVDADEAIDTDRRVVANLPYSQLSAAIILEAGSYDMYLTAPDETDALAGPLRIDGQLGEFFELIALDTVDPATAEIRIIPPP